MMNRPIIIELNEIKGPDKGCSDILKPKVAKAKRLTDRQRDIIEVYKRFQNKYVH